MTHLSHYTLVPLRAPDDSGGSGQDAKGAAKKAAPMSRLGRGLGALIPAAAPRAQVSQTSAPKPVTAEPKLPQSPSPATSAAESAGGTNQPAQPKATTGASSQPVAAPTPPVQVSADRSAPGSAEVVRDVAGTAGVPAADPRSTWNTVPDQAVVSIPIARIQRNPRQPRERFDDAALRALADSIRQDGLLQPIVVRAAPTISPSTGVQMFELIAGERRLRAFTLLGRSTIPALVQKVDDRTSAVLALIENVQREDLNPMERAHGLQRLMHEFSLSQQDLAARVGLDRSTVANLLRLNDLDPHTAAALREGAISTGHAKALLGLADVATRKTLVARVIAEGISVRELEQAVRAVASNGSTAPSNHRLPASGRVVSAQVADLERRIGAHLGTEVQLKTGRKPGSGAITISFGSHSQFEGLMDRIGFDLEAPDRPRGR